jgi:hypothetical protein
MRSFILGLIVACSLAPPAYAVDVTSGSISLSTSDNVQLGRLSRNGVPQDFASDEAYPGEVNPTVSYAYKTLPVAFAANASQDVYYDITFDDADTDLFASAYLNSYDPANKALNWIGDAGTSGNYFGVDALFYDVVVPKGNSLLLVFNGTIPGLAPTSTANYFVQAFSDSEYNENFATASAVPETTTWVMMLAGFGLIGFAVRRRQSVKTTIARA